MKVDLSKEPLIVQQAYNTAKGTSLSGDRKLVTELSELLAKHTIKAILSIEKKGG